MDYLHIKGLKISTRIGVYQWEQQILQNLLIDISLPIDVSHCEDNLEKTIDYAALCERVTSYVETNQFKLIETVANKVAMLIKEEFNLKEIIIKVSKPQAVKNASDIQVVITR